MKTLRLQALACAFLVFSAFGQSADQEEQNQKDKVTSLMDSMAGGIYKLAWPTATYKSWNFDDIRRASGGYQVVIRLNGLSGWDDSHLWLKLGFLVNSDGLKDVWVVDHNAILMAPFKTSQAIGNLALQMAKSYSQSQSAAPAAAPALAELPAAAPTRGGAVCIANDSTQSLTFMYRWGLSAWKQQTVAPGKADVMWWTYNSDTDRSSPKFEIEYDDSFAEGYTGQRYALDRYAVPLPARCEDAKQYRFSVQGQSIILNEIK